MEIEQLRLVLETVGSAGEGAFTIAIVYMVVGVLKCLIGTGAFIFVVLKIGQLVSSNIGHSQFLMRLRDTVKVGCPGPITRSELADLEAEVTHLYKLVRNKKADR